MEIPVKGKKLLPDYHQIGLQGEYGVEQYRFTFDRFFNGIDLYHGIPYMLYQIGEPQEDGYIILDKEATEEALTIIWIVGEELTKSKGMLSIQLKISGLDAALWKSEISRCSVAGSLTDTSPQMLVKTGEEPMLRMKSANYALLAEDGAKSTPTIMTANPDTEPPITISERKINIPSVLSFIATQNDVASETVQIMLPRYFDGHDLSRYEIYLKTLMPNASANGTSGRDDIHFDTPRVESTEIWLTWELRPPQTSYSGKVQLQLYVIDRETGGATFKWETDPGASVNIYTSLDAAPALPLTPSIMDEFIAELTTLASQAARSAAAASSSAQEAEGFRDDAQAIKDTTEVYYDVQDYRVGFKHANEPDFSYTDDLRGPAGRDGVTFTANGLFAFEVDANGDLILHYADDFDPDQLYIDGNGDLIWEGT